MNESSFSKIGFEEFYVIYSCCHIFAMACTGIIGLNNMKKSLHVTQFYSSDQSNSLWILQ